MRLKNWPITAAATAIAWLSAGAAHADTPSEDCLDVPLNGIQTIGSHNSYRVLPPESVLAELEALRPGLREKLEYQHPPFETQLDLGLRLLELDFYADPDGGLYDAPPYLRMLKKGDPLAFDAAEATKPGFKVMHIQGYDPYAHCFQLRDCLAQLKQWSDANPDHTLVTVTLNVKEDRVFDDLPRPPRFDAALLDEVDSLLLDVFGRDRLLMPDDVRGDAPSLRAAVVGKGWPNLRETRRKFMFVLDEGAPSASLAYRVGHPSLEGRVMFAHYPETEDEAAFMVYWDMSGHERTVADLVAKGFLVRVSADINTREARTNDTTRFRKAAESGAQFIATDYYPGNISPFETEYRVSFENEAVMRCDRQAPDPEGWRASRP